MDARLLVPVLLIALLSGCFVVDETGGDMKIIDRQYYPTFCVTDDGCGWLNGYGGWFTHVSTMPRRLVLDCPTVKAIDSCRLFVCYHNREEVGKDEFCQCVRTGYESIRQGSFVPGLGQEEVDERLKYCGIEP